MSWYKYLAFQRINILLSLGSSKRSSGFKIVCNITSFTLGIKGEIVFFSFLSFGLNIYVLHIIKTERLSFFTVKIFGSLFNDLLNSSLSFSASLLMTLVMQDSQHFIVVVINIQLHRMLVICEQSVMSICQISKCSTLKNNGSK